MIYETLEIVKDQVSKYLELKTSGPNFVVLENVSKHDDPEVILKPRNLLKEAKTGSNINFLFVPNFQTIF